MVSTARKFATSDFASAARNSGCSAWFRCDGRIGSDAFGLMLDLLKVQAESEKCLSLLGAPQQRALAPPLKLLRRGDWRQNF